MAEEEVVVVAGAGAGAGAGGHSARVVEGLVGDRDREAGVGGTTHWDRAGGSDEERKRKLVVEEEVGDGGDGPCPDEVLGVEEEASSSWGQRAVDRRRWRAGGLCAAASGWATLTEKGCRWKG